MKQTPALWTGLLAGPIVWFISLEAKFALAPWVCTFHWTASVYLVSLAAMAITAGAGMLSWGQWQHLRRDRGDEALARPRAMALGGVMLSAGVLVVLVAQMLPELMLRGCE